MILMCLPRFWLQIIYLTISSAYILSCTPNRLSSQCFGSLHFPMITGLFGSIITELRLAFISPYVAPRPVSFLYKMVLVGIVGSTSVRYCRLLSTSPILLYLVIVICFLDLFIQLPIVTPFSMSLGATEYAAGFIVAVY